MTRRENGKCEMCGGKKTVEKVAGIEACSTCSFVARAAKNNPELVVAELQRQHGEKYFPVQELMVAATADDEAELDMLKNKLKIYENVFFELRGILGCGEEETPVEAADRVKIEWRCQRDYLKSYSEGFMKMTEMMGKPLDADPVFELGLIMDEYYSMKGQDRIAAVLESTDDGPYASLRRVLDLAFQQAANGKGKERHAKDGEPFEQQKICEIARRVGLGFPIGQAVKKAEESVGLGIDAGIRENLGAINYLAAAVIVMEEAAGGSSSLHIPV